MRLLFIRFSSIGDIVFTTPAIRCAKKQIPGVEIHFLTKASMKSVMEANPYIDQFHYFSNNMEELLTQLKKEQFDYIIDLHKNFRTYKIKKALKITSLTYQKLSWQKLVLTKLHLNFLPKRHISDRCLDTLIPFNVQNDQLGLDYFIPKEAVLSSNVLPLTHQTGYIALVIGASFATKKLPYDQLYALCEKINYPIVLIGGKEDAAMGAKLMQSASAVLFNACGKFSLHESALLVKEAKTVISHDTGFLYIACAFHKKTVAIWGATSPALQVQPYYAVSNLTSADGSSNDMFFNAIVPQLSCQPCSNYGSKKCPQGHFACMRQQNLQAIADKANQYFKEA